MACTQQVSRGISGRNNCESVNGVIKNGTIKINYTHVDLIERMSNKRCNLTVQPPKYGRKALTTNTTHYILGNVQL